MKDNKMGAPPGRDSKFCTTAPPLIIEESDIDLGVFVMDRALEIADQYVVA
jgi:hypothetical protein